MATNGELQASAAGNAAYNEAFPAALEAQNEQIREQLTAAETALLAGMYAVGEACGAAPEKLDELRGAIAPIASEVVRSIFGAAVQEVGKLNAARRVADRAKTETISKKRQEILRNHVQSLISRQGVGIHRTRIGRRTNG